MSTNICDGSSDNLIKTCLRLAGYDKDIESEANLEAFLAQAIEYQEMVHDSKWNKTLEFLMLSNKDHPYNAVRAYEAIKDAGFTEIIVEEQAIKKGLFTK